MTFLTAGALAIALLVLVPLVAHLLQRGRRDAIGFPLVRLVLPTPKLSSRRGTLRDKILLTLRIALIVSLAVIGAVPLVRCDHPVLTRQQGASVALAIVLDDSGSMRARLPNGVERFERAKQHAAQLISQLHEGDLVAFILAGRPARLVAGATPQQQVVRDLCLKTPASDRSTDLAGAMQLAENSLHNLPHNDRRIVVFSDLGQPVPKTSVPLWIPNPELANPVSDCGIVSAIQHGNQVDVEVACSDVSEKQVRNVTLVERSRAPPHKLDYRAQSKQIAVGKKDQSITFDSIPSDLQLDARLDGKDANQHNDSAPVFSGTAGTVVSTLADYTTARAATGGPPLVEQALSAFGGDIVMRPWTALPEDERAYNEVSLLVLDDPPAFGPEVRAALQKWIIGGGLAFACLGQRAVGDALGTSLSPLLEGNPRWEPTQVDGFDTSGLKWLGPTGASFSELHPKARLLLDEALAPASNVRARWSDYRAALVERPLGRGLIWTLGLPATTDNSEIGLRPGFLALFDHLIELTRTRGLSPIATVGHAWKFDRDDKVQIRDPQGATTNLDSTKALDATEESFVPTLAGLYAIRRNERAEIRLAHIESQEITEGPNPANATTINQNAPRLSRLDLSPNFTLVLLIIALMELGVASLPRRDTRAKRPSD